MSDCAHLAAAADLADRRAAPSWPSSVIRTPRVNSVSGSARVRQPLFEWVNVPVSLGERLEDTPIWRLFAASSCFGSGVGMSDALAHNEEASIVILVSAVARNILNIVKEINEAKLKLKKSI